MFYECHSLVSVPDISEWNLEKVRDISKMFYGCKSLKPKTISEQSNNNSVNNNTNNEIEKSFHNSISKNNIQRYDLFRFCL